tara:strand:+ start:10378 stop:10878 length:501 start_codon:yes stop_codon:yes gene_type:complete
MNWYKKLIIAQATGEFWITEEGQAYYADGDIGDMNHEMYIRDLVLSEKNLTPDDIDLFSTSEEELAQLGFNKEEIDVLLDKVDARDYGLTHYGWKRVADNEVQTWTISSGDMAAIASGLYDAYNEEAVRRTYNLEVGATGKYYVSIPFEVIETANPMALREYTNKY